MSVYTKITEDELSKHLLGYSIGRAISLTGISDGIENTNYLLKTNQNEFIFTIFENIKKEDADYLKNYLIEHVNKDEFIFSYEWSKGDVCLWDNLTILHMASEIKNCKRIMHRITIK